uniref:Fructose-2,6-bisphosphatase TIGAR n=1 Tax=Lepisosteus oculatus TaxID=7918 RepID=W5NIY7_LEPOC
MLKFGLTVVRHGETRYNKERLLQGQGVDEPLSALGVRQAEAAGQYLKDLKFTNVFSSDLQRAKQTADIIIRKSRHSHGVEIVCDHRLREKKGFLQRTEKQKRFDWSLRHTVDATCFTKSAHLGEVAVERRTVNGFFFYFYCSLARSLCQQMLSEHLSQSGRQGATEGQITVPNEEAPRPEGLPADGLLGPLPHALVVSHGAYMRDTMKYFVEELQCALPPHLKMSQVFSACPNTGMCRFVITVRRGEKLLPAAQCVFINRTDHLEALREEK